MANSSNYRENGMQRLARKIIIGSAILGTSAACLLGYVTSTEASRLDPGDSSPRPTSTPALMTPMPTETPKPAKTPETITNATYYLNALKNEAQSAFQTQRFKNPDLTVQMVTYNGITRPLRFFPQQENSNSFYSIVGLKENTQTGLLIQNLSLFSNDPNAIKVIKFYSDGNDVVGIDQNGHQDIFVPGGMSNNNAQFFLNGQEIFPENLDATTVVIKEQVAPHLEAHRPPGLADLGIRVEAFQNLTPTPKPPEATPTPVKQEQGPVFSGRSLMKSEDGSITAQASNSVLDIGGIDTIKTNPEYLTNYGKFFKATLAGQMASSKDLIKQYPTLKLFQGVKLDTPLSEIYRIFDENAKLGKNGFQYDVDFGYGVKGIINKINLRVIGNAQEWSDILAQATKDGNSTIVLQNPNSQMKTLFFFQNGIFNSVSSYEYVDLQMKNHSFGNFFNYHLFSGPIVNAIDATMKTSNTFGADISSSDNLFLIFDCMQCLKNNQETGRFTFTLKK